MCLPDGYELSIYWRMLSCWGWAGWCQAGDEGGDREGKLHFLAPLLIPRSDHGLESLTELLAIHNTSPRQTHRIRISGPGLQESEFLPSSRAR